MERNKESVVFVVVVAIAMAAIIVGGTLLDRARLVAEREEFDRTLTASKTFMEAFKGPHKLHRLKEDSGQKSHIEGSLSGFYFLIGGGIQGSIEGKSEKVWNLMFSWEYRDPKRGPIFLLDQLPFDQVSIQFSDDMVPTIEFNFQPFIQRQLFLSRLPLPFCDDTYVMEGYAVKPLEFCRRFRINAVIRCRPQDWERRIQMPM